MRTWQLVDHNENLEVEDGWQLAASDLGLPGCQVSVTRWRAGPSAGVMGVRLDNGALSVDVLPTRGMGLWRMRSGDIDLGWRSPARGPVHPSLVPLMEPGGLGWLDGFDELLVRCGLESNGAPVFDEKERLLYPLHGRIANRVAHQVRVDADPDAGTLTLVGEVEETRFHFLKLRLVASVTLRPGVGRVELRDRVVNLSASPAESQLLYHVNFGPPLLDAGARFLAPVETVVPRNAHSARAVRTWDSYAAPTPGFPEEVFFAKLLADERGWARTLLRNAHGTLGVGIDYRLDTLPCFTLWKNTTSLEDGCVTGIEPGTNFPNPRPFEGEHGRFARLEPRGEVEFAVDLSVHADAAAVAEAERTIARLQARQAPRVLDAPDDTWCAP